MKRKYPPLWLAIAALLLAVIWRMLGAPLSAAQWKDVKTPLWQARVLAPGRMARVFGLWFPRETLPPQDTIYQPQENAPQLVKRDQPEIIARVYDESGIIVQMPLEAYVCGVVAAEMPASYHMEALKAQAVAARTRALYQMENGGCNSHPGADICQSSACCQGYATLSQCRQKWGAETDYYRERILAAVRQTAGERICYNGENIQVMYHAISGGVTENAAAVFSGGEPYLVSVQSAGEEDVRGFWKDTTISFQEMAAKLQGLLPGITGDSLRKTFAISSYTETGRVSTLTADGRQIGAAQLRSALGLRSTWFSLSMDDNGVTFHQRGYGHGVGMSQAGANSMAASGSDYAGIISHYYPGTSILPAE